MAANFVVINFYDSGVNIWSSNKPIYDQSAGFSNQDIHNCGYKTFRCYKYGDSKEKHIRSTIGSDWDPIPEKLLDIWSKRGI